MASEQGTNSFKAYSRKPRTFTVRDKRIPLQQRCANCSNPSYITVPTLQLFAYPPGDPRALKDGFDKEEQYEAWCLRCITSSYLDDYGASTPISVGG